MGAVMLLETGSEQVRFKPKPISGTDVPADKQPSLLLLDGQQRLTSLTQALTGDGVVHTKDANKRLIDRRYYVDMHEAVLGDESIDDAVKSVPGDGVIRANFDRDVVLDLSTPTLEQEQGWFPVRLLFASRFGLFQWLQGVKDQGLVQKFVDDVLQPTENYQIPAIQLKKDTSKSAVATVFEKVNTGGVPLNVFELLTATFAGDAEYFAEHGDDFRLNENWAEIHRDFEREPVLSTLSNTDFLQAVTLLMTTKRNKSSVAERRPAVSAKREDILKLQLTDYLEWREPLVTAFKWAAIFFADQHIFDSRFVPYPTQLVPLAVIRVLLGGEADHHAVKGRIAQWYWCGILGELYGSATESRFARDVEQVPEWAKDDSAAKPTTVTEAIFQETRLYTLRTRGSAAYKGIYSLLIGTGTKDWIKDVEFSKAQYVSLKTDIHHIFPEAWCKTNGIERERYDNIINKTPLAYDTNRSIGGVAPSHYLRRVEEKSGLTAKGVDDVISTHGISMSALRSDDFEAHLAHRTDFLVGLIESAMGKPVVRPVGIVDVVALTAEFEEEQSDASDSEDGLPS